MGIEVAAASAISGILSQCVVHPLDTLRARLMVTTTGGLLSTTRHIITTSGIPGLYRGFGAAATLQAPAVATFLSTYEWSKKRFSNTLQISEQDPRVHLSAGVAAEVVSAVFWVPMEVVKQRAQIRGNVGSFAVFRELLRNEGVTALFKGYGLTVGVFGPYSAVFFVVYEASKRAWRSMLGVGKQGVLPVKADLSSGALAGAVAAGVTTPLDVIKTRLQTQGNGLRGNGHRAYRNAWHAASSIASQEGLRGFVRGASARILWKMPGTAICMASYEQLKHVFSLRDVNILQE